MHTLFWFRRDLRLFDNAGLYHALKQSAASGGVTHCVFVFDTHILQQLLRQDRRVRFIWDSLLELDLVLQQHGGALTVLVGNPVELIPALAKTLHVDAVYTNHDDEPQSVVRDAAVAKQLMAQKQQLYTYKDHVVFERSEVMTQNNTPYTVFTPYKNAWLKQLKAGNGFYTQPYPVERYAGALKRKGLMPTIAHQALHWQQPEFLSQLGFDEHYKMQSPAGMSGALRVLNDFIPRMAKYADTRNFPAIKGPSYLSVHLRFGTVSVRQLVNEALQLIHTEGAVSWLNELIWRDFYHQIMHHHPHAMQRSFKPDYDRIVWLNGAKAEALFLAWAEGQTGYPLVDAAQRQLNQTGYMHNRLRMVSACFLVKDLGIDWRWGEAYFAKHLNDFDLAANNGGWQWAASSGCDAQPYFRIFNPVTQSEKFDAQGAFIRRYVPELAGLNHQHIHAPWLMRQGLELFGSMEIRYPKPIVDHAQARLETLQRYAVLKQANLCPSDNAA
jgi:deoxyribodipyrimidine photo-lyase